ncbi:putative adhesin [Streptomyces sp. NPDC059092]|uniref:putative adhesin n=1 Tax=Streptomyces sp. NPDC059092 TaxID=3346725 RepID=UPI0036A9F130
MFQYGKRQGEPTTPESRPSQPRQPDSAQQRLQFLQSTIGNAAVGSMIEQSHPVVQRARIDDPAGKWHAHQTPGRADGSTVLSGHGKYEESEGAGTITVPDGTTVHFYTPHYLPLSDELGGQVERGEVGPSTTPGSGRGQGNDRDVTLEEETNSREPTIPPESAKRTYGPGDTMPDYTLYHPKGLQIHGNPVQLRRRKGPYDFRGTYVVGLRNQGPAIISELQELGIVAPSRTVTVEESVRLSKLLQPGMGAVHFAACRTAI